MRRFRVLGSDAPLARRERPRVIGITGKKRAGKDSLADVLVSEFGFARLAFADPLKEAVLEADPFVEIVFPDGACGDDECCGPSYDYEEYLRISDLVDRYGWEQAKAFPDVRRLLQDFGQSIRAIDPEFWVRATLDKIEFERARTWDGSVVKTLPAGFVVTDVRYINEADALRSRGAEIVRVVRPETQDGDAHESETEMDGYPVDLNILNTGTLGGLRLLGLDLGEHRLR